QRIARSVSQRRDRMERNRTGADLVVSDMSPPERSCQIDPEAIAEDLREIGAAIEADLVGKLAVAARAVDVDAIPVSIERRARDDVDRTPYAFAFVLREERLCAADFLDVFGDDRRERNAPVSGVATRTADLAGVHPVELDVRQC